MFDIMSSFSVDPGAKAVKKKGGVALITTTVRDHIKLVAMDFQGTYDKRSLPALEPFPSSDPCPNSNSFGSIDDFLADYRHETSTIVSFMSCLEESEIANHQNSTTKHGSRCCKKDSASHASSKRPKVSALNVAGIGAEQSTQKRKRPREAERQPVSASHAACTDADDKSREERRRSKNCEYQRRFREKKMLLELNKAACHPRPCPMYSRFPNPS